MRFQEFADLHGLVVSSLFPSERIKRCGTKEHPNSKNGAFFWNGKRGWIFAWDGEAVTQWFNDPNEAPWTDIEKQQWRRKQHLAEDAKIKKQKSAADKASEMLCSCKADQHDYFHYKGLKEAKGLVLPDGALFIPMRNLETNALQGGQILKWIDRKWQKKMLPGMKAKGAVLRLGSNLAETILCEGYATGLSIEQAARNAGLSLSVLVCFSDSNMVHVAPLVKGHKYIYADNDKSGAGESAAMKTGLMYCMSEKLGNDANDDHNDFGLMYVVKKIISTRRKAA